ncbi:tRNA (guanosine(37)-N1)-methyltransferase TrmD [Patescibacteria group bacterium]|nr:tRNA (guanosine(37)-N1)-methyltransferase TrmD [Patescibacteria group bacterium]
MKIDILTLFPEIFKGPFDTSMLKKAQDNSLVEINIHNLRKWSKDKHKTVDDRPYGGGKGMVIRVDVVDRALKDLKKSTINHQPSTILLTPQGKVFSQKKAQQLSKLKHLILISGHYEGFDERIREHLVDEEISIGDYILTGGEIPAMVIVDSVVRLLPGVLDKEAVEHESFSSSKIENLLDHPTYTRPENFKDWKVPEVLLSGNHADIEKWRKKESEKRTKKKRPDLLKKI